MQVTFLTFKTIVKINSGKKFLHVNSCSSLGNHCYWLQPGSVTLLETLHLVTGTLEKAKGINQVKQQVSVYPAHTFKDLSIWNSKGQRQRHTLKGYQLLCFFLVKPLQSLILYGKQQRTTKFSQPPVLSPLEKYFYLFNFSIVAVSCSTKLLSVIVVSPDFQSSVVSSNYQLSQFSTSPTHM